MSVTGTGTSLTLGSITRSYYYYYYYDYTYYSNTSNLGAITVSNGGSLYLDGVIDSATLNSITNDGGTIFIKGQDHNIGSVLSVGAGTTLGAVVLDGGTIDGGTIAASDNTFLNVGGTLNGVTSSQPLTLDGTNATVTIENGVTVPATSPETFTIGGTNNTLAFAGTQTLNNALVLLGDGGTLAASAQFEQGTDTGRIRRAAYPYYDYSYGGGSYQSGALTIGPGSVVQQVGQSVGLYGNGNNASGSDIDNQGTLLAGYSGGDFFVNAATFTNEGTVLVSNGDTLTFNIYDPQGYYYSNSATYRNTGTIDVAGAGSRVNFQDEILPRRTITATSTRSAASLRFRPAPRSIWAAALRSS